MGEKEGFDCKASISAEQLDASPSQAKFLQDNCAKIISLIDVDLRAVVEDGETYAAAIKKSLADAGVSDADLIAASKEAVSVSSLAPTSWNYMRGPGYTIGDLYADDYDIGMTYVDAWQKIQKWFFKDAAPDPSALGGGSTTLDWEVSYELMGKYSAALVDAKWGIEHLCNPGIGTPPVPNTAMCAPDTAKLLAAAIENVTKTLKEILKQLAELRTEFEDKADVDLSKSMRGDMLDPFILPTDENAKKAQEAWDLAEESRTQGLGSVTKTKIYAPAVPVESQIQYKEQCYLLARILNLAEYKKNVLDISRAKRLPYHLWNETEKNKGHKANSSVLVHGDPYAFINRLTQYPNYSDFFSMTNAEISSLVPMIRLFKVEQDSTGAEAQTEFNFDSYATNVNILSLLDDKNKRGFGVGIKDFSFTYDGSNPFAVKKSIKGKLTIFANSFDELLEWRIGTKRSAGGKRQVSAYRYVDLALKTGGSKLTSSARLSEQAEANLSKLNFRLKVVVGWAMPNGETVLSAGAQDAVNNSFVTLNLTPTVHEFNIDEIGRVTFVINYLAYIEDFFDHPTFNIFANPSSTMIGGKKYNIFGRQLMRRLVVRNLQEACETEKISEIEKAMADEIKGEKVKSLSFITKKLLDYGNVKYINVSTKDLQRFLEDGPFYEQSTGSFAAQITETANKQGLAGKLDSAYASSVEGEEENLKYSFSRLMLDPKSEQIPFFYVSDLIDTILAAMDQAIRNGPDLLDAEYKNMGKNFKGAVTTQADLELEKIKLKQYYARFKKFRVLLGPVEIVSTKKGGESKIVNLGDIPVSLKFFAEWLTNQLLKKDEVLYPLSKFINDFLNNLIRNFLNDDTCFKVSNKQHVRLHQAALTSYTNTDSDYDEITQKIVDSTATLPGKDTKLQYSRLVLGNLGTDEFPVLNISGLRDMALTNKNADEEHNWIVYYAGRTQPTELMLGDQAMDEARGIFHYSIGKDRGLVKTISLSKTQSKYLQVVRFEQNGFDGLEQLRPVYDVHIDAYPIVNAFPGNYIFVDPKGWAPNMAPFGGNALDLTKLGIGGYHMIIRSEHNFGIGLAETKITAKWVAQIDYEEEQAAESAGGDQLPAKCRTARDARAESAGDHMQDGISQWSAATSAQSAVADSVGTSTGDPTDAVVFGESTDEIVIEDAVPTTSPDPAVPKELRRR